MKEATHFLIQYESLLQKPVLCCPLSTPIYSMKIKDKIVGNFKQLVTLKVTAIFKIKYKYEKRNSTIT
jgi:hypothetical protein